MKGGFLDQVKKFNSVNYKWYDTTLLNLNRTILEENKEYWLGSCQLFSIPAF